MNAKDSDRFDRYWTPEPNTGCFLWLGGLSSGGYGAFGMKVPGKKHYPPFGAHRLAWEREHGPITNGLWVLHRCDERTCVNPAHLFLGTIQDNLNDMTAKGRRAKGDGHGQAKLTEAEARFIRASPMRQQALADAFGIAQPTVSAIKRGKIWAHLKEQS